MANRFWVGGTGNWSNTARWSTTSGGAGGASVPGAADVAIYDANSDAGSNFTATVDTAITITTLNITTVDVLVTIAGTTNLTVTGGGTWSVSVLSIAQDGIKFTSDVTFGGSIVLTSGTLDISDVTLSASLFSSSNSAVRSVAFGASGKIVVTGDSTTVFSTGTATNLIYSGTPLVELNYAGSTGTRTVSGGFTGTNANNVISVRVVGGSDIIQMQNTHSVLNLDFNTFAGTMDNGSPRIWGSLTISPSMTIVPNLNSLVFFSTTGTYTITSNGVTIDRPIVFGTGTSTSTVQLSDDLTLGPTRGLTLNSGTFDANDQNIDTGQFSSSNSNARTLQMGSGNWTLRGQGSTTVWNTSTPTNLTVDAETSTVYFASATIQNASGGGVTIHDAVVSGAGTFTDASLNFAKFSNSVSPVTIRFGSGLTTTFTDFDVSGTSGNQVTLSGSAPGSQATLSQPSGTVSASYLTIQDINATGGATWQAFTTNDNVDAGNNLGWDFSFQVGRYIYTQRKNKRILP